MFDRYPRRLVRCTKKARINVEPLEPRLLLAADIQLNDAFVQDLDTVVAGPVVPSTRGLEVNLGPLQLLPGDTAIGPAEGHQMDADVARGGNQYLAVWSDYRTSPDDYPPFATEGLGADVYGRVLDADGNPLGQTPLIINQDFADQESPTAAWNGEHWLVVWKSMTATLPTYEKIMAARVAADGTVLDETPIEVQNNQSYYGSFEPFKIASDGTDWVVMFQASQPVDGVYAIRVAANGTLPDAAETLIHATLFQTDFDINFAQDEYLITWTDIFNLPSRGRLFAPDLQPMGSAFSLAGADEVATDGTDFLVTWTAEGPGAWYTLKGVIVQHDGTRPNPQGFAITSEQYICCTDTVWDGANYWATWGGLRTARVTADGTVLDPGGITVGAAGQFSVPLHLDAAAGGGLQLVWNDGENGAIYPKDVYATSISPTAHVGDDALLSSGVPAQLNSDFAEGTEMLAVAFESRISGITSVKVQRLDTDGTALDAEPIEIVSGPEVSQPGIAFDGTRYMITWQDGFSIFAQRMAIDGTLLETPIEVMTGLMPDVGAIDGTFLVVGTHYRNSPEERVVFTRRLDGATGAILDATPQEIGSFVIYSRFPQVVAFGNRWLVTWQTHLSHNSTIAGTKGAFVDLDGTSPGAFSVGVGWDPEVAVSGDRALFVAVSHTIASAPNDIEGHIMLADGTFPNPPFTISEAPEKQLAPAVTFDGENFLVAWEDKRNAVIYFDQRTDIYATRVSTDGEVLDLDANGYGGVAMTSTPQPERDAALITAGGTTLFATSTFIADRDIEAFRIGIAELTSELRGDFNGDQSVDAADIDMLFAEIRNGLHAAPFDLTGDGLVDFQDADELVLNILGTLYGDANLDRVVDGLDFIEWNENRFQSGGWHEGDFNGDAIVDGTDFIVWNENKFQSATGGLANGSNPSAPLVLPQRASNTAAGEGELTPARVVYEPTTWKNSDIRHASHRRHAVTASPSAGDEFAILTLPAKSAALRSRDCDS